MERKVDNEWVYLMMRAKQMGITVEEIRTFFRERLLAEDLRLANKK